MSELGPYEKMSDTEKRQFLRERTTPKKPMQDALVIAEFAFRCAEKGMNLDETLEKVALFWRQES